MPSRTTYSGRRAARDLLRRIREVYKIIADAELSDAWPGNDVQIVGHGVTPSSRRGRPVPLSNGMYLNVELTLAVSDPYAPRLATTRASYTYQVGDDLDNPRPLFTYQYDQNAPFPYPRCHLHVFAASDNYVHERPFSRLHLPTRRITLEQIVWHLIQEHHVDPRRDDWRQVLWRHEEWFRTIQQDRSWPYDRPFEPPGIS